MTDSLLNTGRKTPAEFRRGPAWYIVFTALAGAFASIPFLARQNAVGLVMVLAGCVVGGFIFRVRSQHWPVDPTVRYRQIVYSLLAVSLPPAVLFMFAGPNGQGPGVVVIGAIVGVSIACGIFASGTRRFGATQTTG
ncbi:MAG: hypothetical protein AAF664_22035 [Planctomycetota bacterium]